MACLQHPEALLVRLRKHYFITNQQTSGQIAALPIAPNGSVSAGTLTPLGSGGPPANETLVGSLSPWYSIIVVGNVRTILFHEQSEKVVRWFD